jgi:hypothetical protein
MSSGRRRMRTRRRGCDSHAEYDKQRADDVLWCCCSGDCKGDRGDEDEKDGRRCCRGEDRGVE